jgi:hypothetical protein
MRGRSVRGARRLTSGGILSQYVEHGEQVQRSNGGLLMCLARQPVRNAGYLIDPRERRGWSCTAQGTVEAAGTLTTSLPEIRVSLAELFDSL